MEEKKDHQRDYSFWPFFNSGKFNRSFLGKFSNSKNSSTFGFTLIELVVVVMMISVLVTGSILILNPIKQLQKAKDAQRQQDLAQVRSALDTYYNDNNCYPNSDFFYFGTSFSQNGVSFMQKVPQDPDFASGSNKPYAYLVDTLSSSCPQWNVLFAKAASVQNLQVGCPLTQMTDSNGNTCVPANYETLGYNYCLPSGKVNCDFITQNQIPGQQLPPPTPTPTPVPTPTPTPTPVPTPSPTPSPTPVPTPPPTPCADYYYCSSCPTNPGSGCCSSLNYSQAYLFCGYYIGSHGCTCNLHCTGLACQW
jgi:prepilin-type N-terminal cleavage/methylation domain-containing protein